MNAHLAISFNHNCLRFDCVRRCRFVIVLSLMLGILSIARLTILARRFISHYRLSIEILVYHFDQIDNRIERRVDIYHSFDHDEIILSCCYIYIFSSFCDHNRLFRINLYFLLQIFNLRLSSGAAAFSRS